MKNDKFVMILTDRMNAAIKERSLFEIGSSMYNYYDGKVVAFEAALNYYSIWND